MELKNPKKNKRSKQKTALLKTKTLIKFVFSTIEIEAFQKKINGGTKRSGNSLIHSLNPREISSEYKKEIRK
tara:strand:+ start:265 stop:480 length:216 start_codon:yes stop_codon:yes gene_type:complete